MSKARAIVWSSSIIMVATLGSGIGRYANRKLRVCELRLEVAQLETEVSLARAPQKQMSAERTADGPVPPGTDDLPGDPQQYSSAAAVAARERTRQLERLFGERPEASIPELKLLTDLDWLRLATEARFDTDDQIRRALSNARCAAKDIFANELDRALRRYTQDMSGQLPTDILQLAPYFDVQPEPEMLYRYQIARGGSVGDEPQVPAIEEKSLIDSDYDVFFSVAAGGGVKRAQGPGVEFRSGTNRARRAFRETNDRPGDWRDLTAYFSPPLDAVQRQRYLRFVEQMEASRKPQ